jgi:hypothetical protein
MKVAGRPRFWYGLVFVFLLALPPRLLYPVSRPMQWYDRSVHFWDALLSGDWAGTYQQYHPGVMVMWLGGLGLRIYAAANGWSGDDLANPPLTPEGIAHYPIDAGVAVLALVIAACIGLMYVLLARLTEWPVAFAGGCLVALDPFYIAQSKVLHLDGLLASFMMVSVLFLILYLRSKKWQHLVFGGIFAGLAFLTKVPAGFLLPYALLLTSWSYFSHIGVSFTCVASNLQGIRRWSSRIKGLTRPLVIWAGVAGVVSVLLWPAMWSAPLTALGEILQNTLFWTETPHIANFFAGRVIDGDPGPLYYAATLAWKTTLVTLPMGCVAIFFLLRRRGEDKALAWWMLIYVVGFFLMMTLGAKKGLRYLVPAFPALDVLAAWGLVQVARAVGSWDRAQKLTWVPTATIVVALVFQAGTTLRHHPYYGTHHNLLLGGSQVAQHVLPLGSQGEGLDLAARFLNDYPGAPEMTAGVQERAISVFRQNFVGRTRPIELQNVDYWVFAINSNQRMLDVDLWGETWETCRQTEPLWTVSFDGVPYVWIYRAYPHTPDAFAIKNRLDMQLGEHIRLLGYRLDSNDLAGEGSLTVTLFWQSDGRLTEDYHIFVHLLSTEGQLVAQHDGVPVQGSRPTWSWRDAEIIQDEHLIVFAAGPPDGTYMISAGMYDWLTGNRLPVVNAAGERLPDDSILLGGSQTALP